MTHILWIVAAIALSLVSLVPLIYIGGRAVYESAKASSWWSIAGGIAVFAALVWIASWGPHAPD